jgi:hypothetical protein
MLEGGLINVGDYIDVVIATPRDWLNTSDETIYSYCALKNSPTICLYRFLFSQSGIPAFALLNFP